MDYSYMTYDKRFQEMAKTIKTIIIEIRELFISHKTGITKDIVLQDSQSGVRSQYFKEIRSVQCLRTEISPRS